MAAIAAKSLDINVTLMRTALKVHQMRIDENEVYTTKEVAEILKISMPTIKRLLKDKKLPSTRIGRQHRFLGKDILDILRNRGDIGESETDARYTHDETGEHGTGARAASANAPEPVNPERKRRSYMLGKRLLSDLLDENGALIFPKGTIVTEETIKEAGGRRKLMELFSNLE